MRNFKLQVTLWVLCFLSVNFSFSQTIVKHEGKFITVDSTLKADSLMSAEISPYKIQLDKTMNEVLAISEQNLFNDKPEGLLGDLTADIVLQKAREYCRDSCKVDFCVLNNGGLRNPLSKGNITRGNIFQLMPFENEIVILKINGEHVKELLDYISNEDGVPVSGIKIKIKNQMPADVMIGDKPFDISQSYTIATSDYLANGGDNMFFFADATKRIMIGKKMRDAIIEYLQNESKNGNTIKMKKDGRIENAE